MKQTWKKKSSGFVWYFCSHSLCISFYLFLFTVLWIISASVSPASRSANLDSSHLFFCLSQTIWQWTDPCEISWSAAGHWSRRWQKMLQTLFFLKRQILSAQCYCLFPKQVCSVLFALLFMISALFKIAKHDLIKSKNPGASLSFSEHTGSESLGLQFDIIADLSQYHLMFTRHAGFIFFISSQPAEYFTHISVYRYVYSLQNILSRSLPGWKEPSVDHKRLAAAGTSPRQALFVWSLWNNCQVVYFWKACVCVVCVLWALPFII